MSDSYDNVAKVFNALISWHTIASIKLEFHAPISSMVFEQLLRINSLTATQIKMICNDFDLPPLCFKLFMYDIKGGQHSYEESSRQGMDYCSRSVITNNCPSS
ncbi:hypothetical protein KIN20_023807 [Parelaphostrongylus tenuis]|uniref:Uncharacterized protein n=1 Tax=Parelaphostrongylus tenuis TaxID=148309 RepID=A0AAD5N9F9_PARTN|nr:hypothetical protein KIN20_023807 [Parelaphostrongylus tenuis]